MRSDVNINKFGKNNIPIVKFKNFEGIDWLNCGFSTRLGGVSKGYFSSMNMSFYRGDDPKDVMENISIFADAAGFKPENVVMPHQCHTTNVQIVGKNECGRGVQLSLMNDSLSDIPGTEEEIDGQITGEKGVVLYVMGADCVPVFIVDTVKKVVSAVHAGWRGTVGDIAGEAVKKMRSEFGSNPKDIKAVVGPSICQDCYEVNFDVAEKFLNKYQSNGKYTELEQPENNECYNIVRPASGDFSDNPTQKYYLNLWEANKVNLINVGVDPRNIEISGICTRCHSDLFYSHRAHGNERGVNIGFITIKND